MDKAGINIKGLVEKLTAAEKKENRIMLLGGIIRFAFYSALVLLCGALAELLFNMDTGGRLIWFIVLSLSEAGLFIYFLVLPHFTKRIKHTAKDHIETAGKASLHFGFMKDELKNALQLAYEKREGVSDELAEAAIERALSKYGQLDFTESVSASPLYKAVKTELVAVIVIMLMFLTITPLNFALYRVINFSRDFSIPPKYTFSIKPGNSTVTKGEGIELTAIVYGGKAGDVSFFIKGEDETGFGRRKTIENNNGSFTCTIQNVQNSFLYYVKADDVKSGGYEIKTFNRPVITFFELKIIPPAYSGLPDETLKDNGNASLLAGSKIYFNLSSSQELKSAFIASSDSISRPMNCEGNTARLEMRVNKEFSYHFEIRDKEGRGNINPAGYVIKLIPDSYPAVALLSPVNNFNVRGLPSINIISRISDDFGFSKMELNYRISESKYEKPKEEYSKVNISLKPGLKEQDVLYNWNLAGLYLAEGDALSCYVEVFDNDNINGPKSAKSEIITLRVPSIESLFKEEEKNTKSIENEIKEVLERADKLKEEMNRNADELKQDKKDLSWDEKNNISSNLDDLSRLGKKIDDIKSRLDESRRNGARNDLLSKETLYKYAELQKLFNELNNDEFKQAFLKMQESLKSMLRSSAQQAMDKLKNNEEYIRNSIERTLNLFKRVKAEQKIDEIIKRTENLADKTGEIAKKLKEKDLADKSAGEELINRQKEVTGGLKNLDAEMKNAQELMKQLEDMPQDEMKKAGDEFNRQGNQSISQNTEQAIGKMQKDNALSYESALSKNLSSFGGMMNGVKKSFAQKNQMKILSEMMKALSNIILLSKEQEKLRVKTESLPYQTGSGGDKTREQNELKNNLLKVIAQVTALSQKTFGITPEMGRELGGALFDMQSAVNAFQALGGQPLQYQRGAMENLNRAAALLKASMDKLGGGSSGGGMASLMQQLEKLSSQQMNLNRLTEQLNGGKLSSEEMAQIQRLAGQQELIRKSLEKLEREAQEAGQSKSLAGSLSKALDDMKSVVEQLKQNRLSGDLVKQQERILSRMLDSQRSLNEKDFEKERESNSGTDFNLTSPTRLNLNDDKVNKLRDELIKAAAQGYKKDYEELIKKYFELLEKKGNKK